MVNPRISIVARNATPSKGGEFHISHDASWLISVFSSRRKERSKVSRQIFNDLNFSESKSLSGVLSYRSDGGARRTF